MVEKEVFLLKPGDQYHLSYWGECVYGAQSIKKDIIVWIYVYPIWQMNFDSKKLWEVKFFLWNQSINSFIPMRRMNLWSPIIKRKMIIMWIHVYPNWRTNFNCKNGKKRSFPYETKVSIYLSQWREWICGAQSLKEERLLCESLFNQIDRQTLKMVQIEVFLVKPKL